MDVIAGASIAFMVVPQGMSYALLAGVPPVWGLYGAFVPVLVYAGFGSSRHLAVGPVAVTSLLISSSVREMVPSADKIEDASEIPAGLEGVQAEYNKVVLQVWLLAVFGTRSCLGGLQSLRGCTCYLTARSGCRELAHVLLECVRVNAIELHLSAMHGRLASCCPQLRRRRVHASMLLSCHQLRMVVKLSWCSADTKLQCAVAPRPPHPQKHHRPEVQITFIVGILWFCVGILQLGFLAKFLSHAVIAGFTAGAPAFHGSM